ncbi:MAG: hypothetical protein ING19_21175 [Azospirillum sp.]|nr:hypothetical protein [Azospirillum sp.]MCA3268565.1 hypothetical protein [Azospirillum sp.]
MVRALLDGRKTQTRRVLSSVRTFGLPDSSACTLRGDDLARALLEAHDFRNVGGSAWAWKAKAFDHQAPAQFTTWYAHLRIAPGDRLWVKETARLVSVGPATTRGIVYAADGENAEVRFTTQPEDAKGLYRIKTTPSIHMPRWASRITLLVEDVRVERLHAITERDAMAEGADPILVPPDGGSAPHVEGFRALWSSINGPDAWAANPWVVVVGFKVVRANIDAPEARAA